MEICVYRTVVGYYNYSIEEEILIGADNRSYWVAYS
jgi:hypothetical protein